MDVQIGDVLEYKDFIQLGYKPKKNDLICKFRIEPARGLKIKDAAGRIASESSTGTWTKLKVSKRVEELSAKVYEIRGNSVKIAYPIELFEPGNMSQILSSIAGNIFGMRAVKNLRLEDVRWPSKLIKSFKGPPYGIKGIRKLLRVKKRPLVGTIIKPKVGLDSSEHARAAYKAWIGGIDLVKDDENLSSLKFNQFYKRVKETLKMRDKAEKETGERKIYMPNITAETKEMLKRAKYIKKLGGEYAMVDILTVGWSSLETLRNENEELKLVIHAHRAGHAAFTRNKKHGISMLVVAEVSRLIGVDQIHVGSIVGKMEADKKEVIEICKWIKGKLENIKPVFPVCSGGIHPGIVPDLIKILGNDIIIQAGGGVWGHPLGGEAGAKGMRQAIDATMGNIKLDEYAKTHKELKIALKKWGYKRPR